MGVDQSKGRVEIDVKRQAWVRNRRPNPAHPKHQRLNRTQSAAGASPQISRRQQHFDVPPSYYQPGPEPLSRGHGDEGRSYHDDGGLRRAQTTRSQNRSGRPFSDNDSGDEAGGVPPHGHRHERPSHHDSRGLSHSQSGGRGISHAQSNSHHGGPIQQGYDFAPPADHTRSQYGASRSQRASQYDSHDGIPHGSHQGSQYGSRHGSHRGSQGRSRGQ